MFLDQTVYNGICTTAADSCTYLHSQCVDGVCGCEDGLVYDVSLGGCCKLRGNDFINQRQVIVSTFYMKRRQFDIIH